MGMNLDNQVMDYTADENIGFTKKEEENGGAEESENWAVTAPASSKRVSDIFRKLRFLHHWKEDNQGLILSYQNPNYLIISLMK